MTQELWILWAAQSATRDLQPTGFILSGAGKERLKSAAICGKAGARGRPHAAMPKTMNKALARDMDFAAALGENRRRAGGVYAPGRRD
jgi:hypothetical protein